MHDFSLPITHVPPPEHALSNDPSLSEPTSIAPLDHTTSEEVPTPSSVGVAEMSTPPPLSIPGVSLIGEDGTSQEACAPLPPMEESPQPPPPPASKRKRRSSKAVVTPPAETDSLDHPPISLRSSALKRVIRIPIIDTEPEISESRPLREASSITYTFRSQRKPVSKERQLPFSQHWVIPTPGVEPNGIWLSVFTNSFKHARSA
jgi:hypothetical protein